MIIVFLLCISLVVLSLVTSKNNFLAPGVITSAVWIIVLSLFWLLQHNLPPISTKFLVSLTIWISVLCISSLLIQSVNFKIENPEPSQFVRNIFFWISILTFPMFLLFVRDALAFGDSGSWSTDLRLAALGQTKHFKEVYDGIHIIIWQVSYTIELFYLSKKNRSKVIVLVIIILAFGFLTMSKIVFLDFFVKTICILFFKNKVSIKHFFIGLTVLLMSFVALQSIRTSIEMDSNDRNDFVVLYLLSSIPAFDTVLPGTAYYWGEDVFRLYYAITYKLGISDVKPIEPILPFIHKPVFTNTYTIMYPFYKNFGYWGVGSFALLYGFVLGWIFKKAQKGSVLFILIFSTLALSIVLQYVAEVLLTNLSGFFKQIVILSLPFFAGKYKIFENQKFISSKK